MTYTDFVLRQAPSAREGCNATQSAFLQWFHHAGGTLNPHCRFADYATMGTGMLAAEPIEHDEILFTIPRHMLLNVRNSRLPTLCRAYDAQTIASPAWDDMNVGWLGLMTTMMWEQTRTTEEVGRALDAFLQRERGQAWLQAERQQDHQEQMHDDNDDAKTRAASTARASMAWQPYFDVLPHHFDTPIFWSDADLSELKGTSVTDKIGKEEATAGYVNTVRPYIRTHAHIFLGTLADDNAADRVDALVDRFYSLQSFHVMGSRILSRSFHVKGDQGVDGVRVDTSGQGQESGAQDAEANDDEPQSETSSSSDSDGEGESDERIEDVSMVPMADMLNARYGCDNARLFYRTDALEMRATQRIAAGEQVWNTYGEPPSSDLLRRYGYVDLGNAADVVEIGLDDLIVGRTALPAAPPREALLRRIEWACGLGLDEVSVLSYPIAPAPTPPYRSAVQEATASKQELREAALQLPEDLLVLARVLCLTGDAFDKAAIKDHLPTPRIDATESDVPGVGVAQLLLCAIDAHCQSYPTTLEQDEELMYGPKAVAMSLNSTNATVVRLSEKRILNDTRAVLNAVMEAVAQKKRQATASSGNAPSSNKKAKRA